MGILLEFPTERVQSSVRPSRSRNTRKGRVLLFEGIHYSRHEDTPCKVSEKSTPKSKKRRKKQDPSS